MNPGTALAIILIVIPVAVVLFAVPILVWSVRSGQFSDKDHARWLPLLSDGPVTHVPEDAQPTTSLRAERSNLLEQKTRQDGSEADKRLLRFARNDGDSKGGGGDVLP
jgi:cbb3-type cytochrome oxidase maturation protein